MADFTQLISQFLYSRLPQISGGGGSASGVLTVSTTAYATTGTSEEDAWTYSLPANTLAADGRALRITVGVLGAGTVNNKTVKVYFGATSYTLNPTTAAPNGQGVTGTLLVVRTGATSQSFYVTQASVGSANQAAQVTATPAETLSGAVTIKVTLTTPTTAGDATFKYAMVELLN